jgi:hypothetical protein
VRSLNLATSTACLRPARPGYGPSSRAAEVAMNSIAQQASPKVIAQSAAPS